MLERDDDKFAEQVNPALDKANALGQKILKAEWNRIKGDIEKP